MDADERVTPCRHTAKSRFKTRPLAVRHAGSQQKVWKKCGLARILTLLFATALTGCQTTDRSEPPNASPIESPSREEASEESNEQAYVFGWGNRNPNLAEPRGGTSRGAPVELAPTRPLPLDAIRDAETSFERDRAAILSLAGDYKVSFHFLETLGLHQDYAPRQPYHSWATEKVFVIEDTGEFISLQHILVMYFKQDDGSISEPMVMKHWRQDWTYQDTNLRAYQGNKTWARETRDEDAAAGSWTQAVWQVDDSPRYEALGRWSHDGNRSVWTGETVWRPLPRREYTIRDDYDIMEGSHRIIITPTGWLHEQNNWKRVKADPESTSIYRGHEIGLDRYELIDSPNLDAASDYWQRTAPYWAEVRAVWQDVFAARGRFTLKASIDRKSQFEHHFEYAGQLDASEAFNQADAAHFARETIEQYLVADPKSHETSSNY